MAFNPNVPKKSDRLSVSQGDFLENFRSIDAFLGENHDTFGNPDEGKHKFVQMTNIPLIANFPDDGENTSVFFSNQKSNQINVLFKNTDKTWLNRIVSGFANRLSLDDGYAFVGNSLFKWGVSTNAPTGGGTKTVDFPIINGIPWPVFATNPLVFIFSTPAADGDMQNNYCKWTGTSSPTGFDIFKNNSARGFRIPFLAIGTFSDTV